jgi:predicted DNA-binding transcriptional regulator AlpA
MVATTRYLDTREAASYTRLGKSTLERLRIEGTGPAFIRATANRVVYSIADLDDYLSARRHQSTAGADRSVA